VRVLILGVNHQIQRPFGSSRKADLEFVQRQKEHFAQLVREHIRKHRIGFVGEEANREEASIVEAICTEEDCCYANIEMTTQEREQRKIPSQYNASDVLSSAEKARGNQERERYMVDEVLTNAQDSDGVLVICGDRHSDAMADLFRAVGHSVEMDDLRKQSWYVEDWMDHMLHNW
jgi:hypothetical protein